MGGLPRLVVRNFTRKKVRVGFTACAMATVVTAFVLIRAVQTAWLTSSNRAHTDRLTTQDGVSYAVLLPRTYPDEVAKLPHVKQVTFYNWLGARDPAHPTEFFPTLAVDPQHYLDVFSEVTLDDTAREAWRAKKDGALVGEVLAAKMGWKVGDRLSLESGFYAETPVMSFEIVGLYGISDASLDRSTVLVRWDYFNELIGSWHNDRVGWIVTSVEQPSHAAQVASSIDAHFKDRGQETFTQSESAFNASFQDGMNMMMRALSIACFGLIGIMVLLVGNTVAMGVRERSVEYATMRAIGFSPWQVASSIAAESLLLGGFGGFLGLSLSIILVDGALGSWVGANLDAFLPYFGVDAATAALAFGASLFVSALAASLPAYRMFNLSVTEGLKRLA